jgi:hypothetical protein
MAVAVFVVVGLIVRFGVIFGVWPVEVLGHLASFGTRWSSPGRADFDESLPARPDPD